MPDQEFEFDVFLSHNSKDKPAVEKIARMLRDEYTLKPWLDKWKLTPGKPWQEELEDGLNKSETIAVFLGEAGLGKWENEEMRYAVDTVVAERQTRVIPVLLPGAPEDPNISRFLRRYTWVDLREGYETTKLLYRLVCGIKGIPPEDTESAPRQTPSSGDGEAVAVSSQAQGSGQSAEQFRRAAPASQPESNKIIGSSLQAGANTPGRREGTNTPTEADLKISRERFAELNQAQAELKDFVDGYILFSEPWVECGKAYSKLGDQLDDPTDDIYSLRFRNDIKEMLKHAKTKMVGDMPGFLRSKSEFSAFNEELDEALRLVENILPKTEKENKMDVISNIHDHVENAANMAQAIVVFCQNGATSRLTEISVLIKGIFAAGQASIQEVSGQAQNTNRLGDRLGLENKEIAALRTSVALSNNQESYRQ